MDDEKLKPILSSLPPDRLYQVGIEGLFELYQFLDRAAIVAAVGTLLLATLLLREEAAILRFILVVRELATTTSWIAG